MSLIYNSTFKTLEGSLSLRRDRQTLLAGNLSNIDTPGYKAKDIDFKEELDRVTNTNSKQVKMRSTHSAHITLQSDKMDDVTILNDASAPEGLDKNNINLEEEVSKLIENSSMFQVSTVLVSKKLALLRYSIND